MLGLAAAVGVAASTRSGLAVGPDSSVYIAGARNLLQGNGLVSRGQPVTHFPFGYPCLLAINGAITGDAYRGAVVWNALGLGLTIALTGLTLFGATRGSWPAMLGGALFTLAATFRLHQAAASEPPYLACTMAAALAVGWYFQRPSLRRVLVLAIPCAIALTVRYAAASLLPPITLMLLLSRTRVRARLAHVVLFGAITCLPLGLWLIHNHLAYGSAANRSLAVHPFNAEDAKELARTMTRFYFPPTQASQSEKVRSIIGAVRIVLLTAMAVPLAALAGAALRRTRLTTLVRQKPLTVCLLLLSLGYLGFAVLSKSLFDAAITFGDRLAAPFNLLGALTCIAILFGTRRGTWARRARWISLPVLILAVAFNARVDAGEFVKDDTRLVYAGPDWQKAEGIALARGLDKDIAIYSNSADATEFLTQRPARMLPCRYSSLTLVPNARLAEEMAELERQLAAHKAIVIFFEAGRCRDYLIKDTDLDRLRPQIKTKLREATVYGWATGR